MFCFNSSDTVDFEGYTWGLSEIMVERILKIIRMKNQPPFMQKDKG